MKIDIGSNNNVLLKNKRVFLFLVFLFLLVHVAFPRNIEFTDAADLEELEITTESREIVNYKDGKDIAIVYICTGAYYVFWEEFYKSMEEKFISSMRKDYYVFTDYENIYAKEEDNVHVVPQENLGWPGNTLKRFHMFLSQENELLQYKYIFFMNANIICNEEIGEEFLPRDEGLLFVQHHAYYNRSNKKFTYERNSNSTAYIPMGQGKYYICGGVNGGKAANYLHMCEVLKNRIDEDEKNGITAVWHDESHINRYLLDLEENQYKLLNASYCFPEYKMNRSPSQFPFHPILFFRSKERYIDLKKIKGNRWEMMGNNKNRIDKGRGDKEEQNRKASK